MKQEVVAVQPMRPVIIWSVAVCVALAVAPWLTGGQEPLGRLISVLAVLLGSLLLWRQPVVRPLKRGPLVWAFSGYVGWALLSLIWSVNRFDSVLWITQLVAAGLIFRLVFSLAGEPGGREALVKLYLMSAGLFCVYGLWLYVTGAYPRLTGTFYWANPAAAYLLPAILVLMSRVTGRRWWLWGLGLAGVASTFVLTDSRGAMLVGLIVVGTWLIAKRHPKQHWIHLLFSILSVVVLTTIFIQLRHVVKPTAGSQAPGQRYTAAALGESRSTKDRLNYLISAVDIWADHPVWGTGAGTFVVEHPKYQKEVVSASSDVHNYYVQSLPELGLIGFLLLVWLVVIVLLGVGRGLVATDGHGVYVLALLALLVHIGLDIDASYPALLSLVGLFAALVYGQGTAKPRQLGWKLPFTALIMAAPVIVYYPASVWASRAANELSDNNLETAAQYYGRSHASLVYDPDWVSAQGIADYSLAIEGGAGSSQDAKAALGLARQAQKLDSRDAQHWQLEGRLLAFQGDAAGAQRALEHALVLDPYNHPDYAYDLARIMRQQGNTAGAITVARHMLGQYPADVYANRSADLSLKQPLVGLAVLVGNIELRDGHVEMAEAAARQAAVYDKTDYRLLGLQSAIAKAKQQ